MRPNDSGIVGGSTHRPELVQDPNNNVHRILVAETYFKETNNYVLWVTYR